MSEEEQEVRCKNCSRTIDYQEEEEEVGLAPYWYHIWSGIQACDFFTAGKWAEPVDA